MQSQRYQSLNPLALAIAAGCVTLLAFVFFAFPMMGMGGMMGGYAGGGMWGNHSGYGFGFGMFWIVGVLLSALFGAIFGWIYNAVNGAQISNTAAGQTGSGPNVPAAR